MNKKIVPVVIILIVVLLGLIFYFRNTSLDKITDQDTPEIVFGDAQINTVELDISGSFPVRLHARMMGEFKDTCTKIHEINQSREGSVISVSMTSRRAADQLCAQVITQFVEVVQIDIEDLLAGEYTLDVNGIKTTFELEKDNIFEDGK